MASDAAEIANDAARFIGGAGPIPPTDIVLTWDTWPSNSVVDPTDGSHSGAPIPATQTLPGFVHWAEAKSTVRVFNEVEAGDIIIDFAGDAPLDGKENLTFNVQGTLYVSKEVSSRLATAWDVALGDQKVVRTVLLRKKT